MNAIANVTAGGLHGKSAMETVYNHTAVGYGAARKASVMRMRPMEQKRKNGPRRWP
jgi:hypothetical protein